jgi:hypothetical protein
MAKPAKPPFPPKKDDKGKPIPAKGGKRGK